MNISLQIQMNEMYARRRSLPEVRDGNDDQQVERCREKRHEDHQTSGEYERRLIRRGSPAGQIEEMREAEFVSFKGLHLPGHEMFPSRVDRSSLQFVCF